MWTKHVLKLEGIKALFKENLPTLRSVFIEEIKIHPNTLSTVYLTINTKELPDEIPSKWKIAGVDGVSITLVLTGSKHIRMNLTSNYMGVSGKLNITSRHNRKFVQFVSAEGIELLGIEGEIIYLSSVGVNKHSGI